MNVVKKDTKWMATVGLMMAIIIVLANTPLGMIQLPIIKATTVHIPVIIGAIVLGPFAGGILGATFGVCSLISNTMAPTLLSFAFSPFVSETPLDGLKSVWVAVCCRILLGVVAGWLWVLAEKIIKGFKLNKSIAHPVALPLTAFIASFFHTAIVMGSIYVLFAQQYADAKNVAVTAVFGLVMGTVTASGIPEAIAATVLVTAVCLVLLKIYKKEYVAAKSTFKINKKAAKDDNAEA